MKAQGFTLIELVILLTIMAILGTISVTRMPSFNFYKSYSFSSILAADLNLTKVLSITQNQKYRLVTSASSYQIQDQNGSAFLNPETNNSSTSYPGNVSVSPLTTIVFDSLGQPYNAAGTTPLSATLNLSVSASETSQIISITPQTGFIQ